MGDRQTYEQWPVDRLVPHPNNPNRGDVALIRESIQANDWYGAVVVQAGTDRILAGEHRWRAAKAEGATSIPVIVRECDDVEALRILLADNETARHAELDPAAVVEVVTQIRTLTGEELSEVLAGTGMSALDLEQFEATAELADEEEPEPGPEPDQEVYPPGDDSSFGSQYGVLIVCADEDEQRSVFEIMQTTHDWNVRCLTV